MSLRFYEIAESRHRIQNPYTEEQLRLLGQICGLREGMRQLDLACGKGEMLTRWAHDFQIAGVGVDLSEVFLAAARERAAELDVAAQVTFVQDDAARYPSDWHAFDLVSCIGATWIGGGVVGTLTLMKRALKDERSLLLVGEPYWIDPPPDKAYAALDITAGLYGSLDETLDRFEQSGMELVEMVLADQQGWDRYAATQWMTVRNWLDENPHDPDAAALADWIARERRAYLTYGRRYLGWGIFVLRQARARD